MPGAQDDLPIAVISANENLGDCIATMAMLRALRRGFPARRIVYLSPRPTPFAHGLRRIAAPFIDEVREELPLERPPDAANRSLRALPPFSLVIDGRRTFKHVLRARLLMRYRRFVTLCVGHSLRSLTWYREPGNASLGRRRIELARLAVGGPPDWRGRIAVPPEVEAEAAALLPAGRRMVGLAIGSSPFGTEKRWPLERFAAVANQLAAAGRQPVFLFGPDEAGQVPALRAAAAQALFPGSDSPAGCPRLELTIALCGRMDAALCNDTAVMHILCGQGVPLVALFGPSARARRRRGKLAIEARGLPVGGPVTLVAAQEFGGTRMEDIPVAAALAALERLPARE